MLRTLQNALAATTFAGLSLFLWRLAYISSDWAALALLPLSVVIVVGAWSLALAPWKAHLRLALREDSALGRFLTGRTRAAFVSGAFTFFAVTLLASQALTATPADAITMLIAFLLSSCTFSSGQKALGRHFHQPFARAVTTSIVTWVVALPFTLIFALSTWAWATIPGAMLNAGLQEAVQIGLDRLPERGGWIAGVLAIPYGYEATKLWIVVQLRDYPVAGALFSLDAALFSFVLCRSAIVITQFIEAHVAKAQE